jgi:hypothetical protein
MKLQLTPEQIRDLAQEIAFEVRADAFEGDKWLGCRKAEEVVTAVLTSWEAE